jgi:hypothetical protein
MVHFLGVARHEIQKTIVADESQHPIAVQIDYADRLEIERSLNLTSEEPKTADPSRLEKLLDVAVLDERIPHGMLERLKTFNAKREGWSEWILGPRDEKAVLEGCRFDIRAAERVRTFFSKFLRHSKGQWAGHRPSPWLSLACPTRA